MIEAELPDGRILEFPDGTDQAVIQATVRKMLGVQTQKPSGGGNPLFAPEVGFAQGLYDVTAGGAQALTRALPKGVVDAVNKGVAAINEMPVIGPATKAIGMVPATVQDIDRGIKAAEAEYNRTGSAAAPGRFLGNIAATLPIAAAGGAGLPAAMATGAASSAMQPVLDPGADFWTQKGIQAAVGGVGGAAGNLVGRGLSRVLAPKTDPAVKALMDKGVTPTPGQIMGGPVKALEDKITSIGGPGDFIVSAQKRATNDFNRAIYQEVLDPIGAQAPKEVGRAAVGQVREAIRGAYDDILPKLKFRVDQQFADELQKLAGMASELPEKEAKTFNRIVGDKLSKALGQTGVMDGQTFKTLESSLGNNASMFRKSSDAYQKQLGDALAEVQKSLREGLWRSNQGVTVKVGDKTIDAAERLSAINNSYARFVRLREASQAANTADEVITPEVFSSAVRRSDRSAGKGSYAAGEALMQDLADAGKATLGGKYPNSGTAGRVFVGAGLGGALGAISPAALAGAGLLSLPYTQTGQRLAAGLLAGSRPAALSAVAPVINESLPLLPLAASSLLAQR